MMAEAEAMAQELEALTHADPFDAEAFATLNTAYGAKFVEASAQIAEATYAEEDDA